ncbi:hypothetical protein NEILACOT_05109 [Neisseria lactamica ATCC 23970]|uniref:Uncharacterized protein n=1 Tax=Neisseria lactamica ATCC 23970 TaxID=546265 RepID=D0WC30_NEILA|nr:hypothetical protein NEILACOT_05109 [Neisseria lactamica ATCC 23970]
MLPAVIRKMVSGGVAAAVERGFLTQGAAAACGTFRRAVLQIKNNLHLYLQAMKIFR